MTVERLQSRWRALAERLGLAGAVDEAFEDLRRRYAEPHRAYHNLDHVATCLCALDDVRDQAAEPDLIEAALWYHDAVYVPGDPRNETESGNLASERLQALGAEETLIHRVALRILATRMDQRWIQKDPDHQLISDIDLVILAARPEAYDRYAAAIREEAGLPGAEFNRRRAAFLQEMLERPRIYQTPLFRERHEDAARENLRRELDTLEKADH